MKKVIIVLTISLLVMSVLSGCVDKNNINDDTNKDTVVTGGADIDSNNDTNVSNGQVDVTSDSEYEDNN